MDNSSGRRRYTVVDIQSVDHKDPSRAVKTFELSDAPIRQRCDILIAGGGLGGVAAALHAVFPVSVLDDRKAVGKGKLKVFLTEETNWLGGQATSQGVSAFDENWLVESSGATSEYQRLRSLIRRHYIRNYKLASSVGNLQYFDPGKCWVSRLAFEPKVAIDQIDHMLSPAEEAGNLNIFKRLKAVEVATQTTESGKKRIKSVMMVNLDNGEFTEFQPRICIDATELGDIIKLAGLPYATGAESKTETGEAHAHENAEPDTVQDFVYPFVITQSSQDNQTKVEAPAEYGEFHKQFSLLGYRVFESAEKTLADGRKQELLPFWTYRRLVARENFNDSKVRADLSMINWEANDFRGENIIDVSPDVQARRLARAKSVSLGFLYWLQNEAQRDDDHSKKGYPEFALKKELMDSKDGLSKFPYIRESRRIKAETTVIEQDIGQSYNPHARAKLFSDSVGIGHYPIDIHGDQIKGMAQGTKPFQVPLGALIARDCDNLLPACKNIGVTHITNGAYRLHPIEWAIGTASGALARLSIGSGKPPRVYWEHKDLTFALQKILIESGAPLYWFDDVPTWHEHFLEVQLLAVAGLMPGAEDHLSFEPDAHLTRREVARLCKAVFPKQKYSAYPVTDVTPDDQDYEALVFAASKELLAVDAQGRIRPDSFITVSELASLAAKPLTKLPQHRNVFIEVISDERVESTANQEVTRSEFALWFALMIDYKKLWTEIDADFASGRHSRRRTGIPDLPVSAP